MQGTLSAEQFHFYVEQDDYYLQVYSSVLARLSSLAPHEEERKMWAKAVTQTITVEQEMHREFPLPKIVEPSPLTLAYTDFLRAEVASDYVVGVAAILPCFWLYAQLSEYLPEEIKDDHPYKLWIETYRDEEFLRATAQTLEVMEHQLTHASNAQREQARNAFVRACSLEADFFTQALLIDPR
ncbi:TenA family transcriptional regulator [Mycobacteroides abscessus subsp. abscessus]|nr:TenA family transcriptional regulator [Mycobacteroides abscessus subsp. abscessus]